MNKIKEHIENFNKIYNYKDDIRIFFAPGRVNLIGEHIDYHGGNVLPCAINYGTYLIIRKRQDNKIRGYSYNFQDIGIKEASLTNLTYKKSDDWFNYPKGIIKTFMEKGYPINTGFDMYFYGDIPNGAGLSSSASIELVTSESLKGIFELDISTKEMVLLSQETENKFMGVNCGIMDQYAIGFGRENKAILLDCAVNDHQYIPLELGEYSIVIINSNKKRALSDSAYNKRRANSFKGLELLKKHYSIKNLVDLSMDALEESRKIFSDLPIIYKRVKHIVTENQRTIEASKKLSNNSLKAFGQLMIESHNSLKSDFEVTGDELDYLVSEALEIEGVLGARMTGAGFGGCTVNLVKKNKIDLLEEVISRKYIEKFGYAPSIYRVEIGDGSKEITEVIS